MNLTGIILSGGRSRRFGFNKLKLKTGPVPMIIDQIFKLSFFCNEIIISTSLDNHQIVFSQLARIRKYQKYYDFKKLQNIDMNFDNPYKINFTFPDIKIILDETNDIDLDVYSLMGPIIGIYTSLTDSINFYSIVVAIDMPFISYRLLQLLTDDLVPGNKGQDDNMPLPAYPGYKQSKDARIIKTEKGFEVLCGLYSKDCLGILKENIKRQKYKISEILNYIDTETILDYQLELNMIDDLNFFNINRMQDYYKFRNIWQNKKKSLDKNISFTDIWADFFFR